MHAGVMMMQAHHTPAILSARKCANRIAGLCSVAGFARLRAGIAGDSGGDCLTIA